MFIHDRLQELGYDVKPAKVEHVEVAYCGEAPVYLVDLLEERYKCDKPLMFTCGMYSDNAWLLFPCNTDGTGGIRCLPEHCEDIFKMILAECESEGCSRIYTVRAADGYLLGIGSQRFDMFTIFGDLRYSGVE